MAFNIAKEKKKNSNIMHYYVFILQLKEALSDAQKNASLLTEYHALYELQRKRLEKQVVMLTDEKELWSTAAYSLALKVKMFY